MRKILLHYIDYGIGGPNAVISGIENSFIGRKYELKRVVQHGGCGFNPLKALQFIAHFRRVISLEHADAILISGLQYSGFLMTVAAKLSNVKEIITAVHGSEWDVDDHTVRRWTLKHLIEPAEIRLADKIFTVCRAEQKRVKALRWARRGCNCGTIYNTFPAHLSREKTAAGQLKSIIGQQEGKIVVASVGRVTERKGHAYIIEAAKRCRDERFVFVIIGDGDYLPHYCEQCSRELDEGRLFLLGARNDVPELLRDVDIFLFASLNENHSVALLEAVAMRCAALVTAVGGNTETIRDGQTGIIVPPANADAIVKGLEKLGDKALREKYSAAAYDYCSRAFSEENTLGRLDKLFDGGDVNEE